MMWAQRYTEDNVAVWVTTHSDAEAYFCDKFYLACLYNVSTDITMKWITEAMFKCKDTKKVFFEKRKVFLRLLYENGGSPASDELWEQSIRLPEEHLLGKTLHKALKGEVKAAGYDDKLLCRFTIPKGYEVAPELCSILEYALSQENEAKHR
jgi:hypothetical protein